MRTRWTPGTSAWTGPDRSTRTTEYAVYAAALQTTDPKKKIELFESLEQRNPSSEYLPKAYGQLFLAYRQAGANDKALALAEKVLAKDQSDPDMLLVVASDYVAKKKEPEKVHAYTAKAAEMVASQPKPEGVADADWQKMRGARLGAAHFLNGSLYYAESNWAQADKQLREALPHLENAQVKAEALYYLGFANYKLEKAQEAANYYRQCAAIKSRFQGLATKNLQGIKSPVQRSQVNLLIPNLGSTSLKYQMLEMPSEKVLARGRMERVTDYREAIAQVRTAGVRIDAVALKAVHAGPDYRGTFVIDDAPHPRHGGVPARGAGAQRHLSDGHPGVPRGAAGRAAGGRLRDRVPRHHAGCGAALRGAAGLARRRRGEVRLPWRVPPVHRRTGLRFDAAGTRAW